jgi:phage terminase Nu1 subunit (DNA packaging protein)
MDDDTRSDRAYVRGLRARTPIGRAIARILEAFWRNVERRRSDAQTERIDRYLNAIASAKNDRDILAAAEQFVFGR